MNSRLHPSFLKLLSLFVFLCSAQLAFSQRTVTGTITDGTTGEGLVGATVVVKGARATGTVTDYEGNFTLKVPNDATTLIVSFTGFETVEQSIAGVSTVSVQLAEGQLLKDVVVIGYGTVKREDATGVVQSVSSDKFNRGAITGPQDLLAGKLAGVVVTPGNGAPGEGATIRIRGESSLNANNDPLIIVDGIPLDNGSVNGNRNQLNVINPNDIETFTVLKDASAAAIYGNRASAGVIIITTKKGSSGATKIGYSANVSMGQVTKTVDVLNAAEFKRAVDSLPAVSNAAALPLLGNADTDWQKEIYQKAYGTDHNMYMSGAVNRFPYRISVGYSDKEGVLKTDHFNRFTGGVNVSPAFFNNTLQFNINYKRMVSRNRFADRGAIGTAVYIDPTQPVYDERSPFGGFWTWQDGANPRALAPNNPLAMLLQTDDRSLVNQRILNGSIDYRLPFFKQIRAHLSLGLDRSNGEGRKYVPENAAFAYNTKTGSGTRNVYEGIRSNRLLENYLNYKETFGHHDIELMVGHSWQQFREESSSLNATASGKINLTQDPIRTFEGSEYFLISQFARLNYNLYDRVYLTGTVRRDGTSRFGATHRWGIFPAGAVAVKVMDNKTGNVNLIKLRLGVGTTGQQEVGGRYPHLAQYQGSLLGAGYQFGNQYSNTIRPNGYNADLRWEETTTYNAGIDFSFVNNRIGGAIDAYQRNTSDLIVNTGLAALSNLTNRGDVNIGDMEAKGIELSLNFSLLQQKNLTWDLSTNVAYNDFEITKLNENPASGYAGIPVGGIAGGVGSNIQIHTVGYTPYSFYVYKQKYDTNGKLLEGQFADTNGDDIENADDFYRYQAPYHNYTLGVTNNFNVQNFSLSFGGRFNTGGYNFDNVRSDIGYLDRVYTSSGFLANTHQSALDLNVRKQSSLTFSDAFVKDATFFRMDHITLGYQLPQRIAKNMSLSATVQNPFVITKYDGLDPEIFRGIDNSFYPRPRTYVLGVQADF
jgi:TonB-dependent starch-binding outer membrane protein SusC